MKRILFSLLALSLAAQDSISVPRYTVYKETVLVGAAEVITLYKAPGTGSTADIRSVYFYCSVACTVTVESGGTIASGTPITPTKGYSNWPASQMTAYSGTSISGTTVRIKYSFAAEGEKALDMDGTYLAASGESLTVRVSSITGTFRYGAKYKERN